MDYLRRIKIQAKYFLLAIIFLAGIFCVAPVDAATISLGASASSVKVGGTFTVRAAVNTQGKYINTVDSAINFPNDLVEVTAVNSRSSVLSMWVEGPSTPGTANSSGFVSFVGGVPTPGYVGVGGEIITITFKAKNPGTANFYYSGAAVRENNEFGTDILSGQSSASVTITGAPTTETPAPTEPAPPVAPKMPNPIISSATYPDQSSWYSALSGTFNFGYPAGASTVQTLIGNNPSNVPSVSYTPPISSKTVSNLSDGIWYFSLRYRLNGEWSNVSRYKIQIDSVAPKSLTVEVGTSTTELLTLNIKASDLNLDRYEIFVDGGPVRIVTLAEAERPVSLQNVASGSHQVKVVAYDKAGNKMEVVKEIISELVPVASLITTVTTGIVATSLPAVATSVINLVWPTAAISWQTILPIIGWLVLAYFLLYGWYKFFKARRKLVIAKRHADEAFMMLLDRADQQIEVLNKSAKKRKLSRSETYALVDLKLIISKVRDIKKNDD